MLEITSGNNIGSYVILTIGINTLDLAGAMLLSDSSVVTAIIRKEKAYTGTNKVAAVIDQQVK